ncbi:hypothetical protein [Philosamia cynthia ricini nucleopolyhedrovirus virus]|nr:hypothetical protein [Philosamia cynthia ricini nucleopolyhedrovirus virus]
MRRRRCTAAARPLCAVASYCANAATQRSMAAISGAPPHSAATLISDGHYFKVVSEPDGCVALTVRRYNPHVVGFAGMRSHTLERLRGLGLLPAGAACAVRTVPAACARCRRSLTLFPAVSCLPCGHSCLCADCDELLAAASCFKCSIKIEFKLKYRK